MSVTARFAREGEHVREVIMLPRQEGSSGFAQKLRIRIQHERGKSVDKLQGKSKAP